MFLSESKVYFKDDLRNCFGETAAVQAAIEGHSQIVEALRPFDGSSLQGEVLFGLWPIHLAAQSRPVHVFRAGPRRVPRWGLP